MGGVLKLSVHTSKFSLSWRRLEVGWKLVQGLKSLAGHIVIGKVAPPLTTQVLSSDTARVCTVKSDECTLLLPLALASLSSFPRHRCVVTCLPLPKLGSPVLTQGAPLTCALSRQLCPASRVCSPPPIWRVFLCGGHACLRARTLYARGNTTPCSRLGAYHA